MRNDIYRRSFYGVHVKTDCIKFRTEETVPNVADGMRIAVTGLYQGD